MQQLNFLTGYDSEIIQYSQESQTVFWDNDLNIIAAPRRKPVYRDLEQFFSNLNYSRVPAYKSYWKNISPKNDGEIFQRWLFAFMSVHTSWKANIVGYTAIKDWWSWLNRWDNLLLSIKNSRVGMQNNRAKYLEEFSYKFWEDPSKYRKTDSESWSEFRDRLQEDTLGLGPAKTSFAIEMCYPNTAKVVCLDTHMFQVYGMDQTKDARHYASIERHWIDMCKMWNVPPYIARCLYWDTKQGYLDSRYWSHVLEKVQ